MPSFDVVSEVDMHEAANAVDQANREVSTRFDFKGTDAEFELAESEIKLTAEADFQLGQMRDILRNKLGKRGVDIGCLDAQTPEIGAKKAVQSIVVRQGLDTDACRQIVKTLKNSKLKVQSAIQGDKVRVSGKKRDDLQQAISIIRESGIDLPLQFQNFRD